MNIDSETLDAEVVKAKSLIGKTVKDSVGNRGIVSSFEIKTATFGFSSHSVGEAVKNKGYCVAVKYGFYATDVVNVEEHTEEIKVNLNSEYTAYVSKDGIKVGCQIFPLSILDELVKARDKIIS